MREVGQETREERTKERRDLQMVDTNRLVLHPDLLADAVNHHPGFVDCKLIMRTCVELCYSLPHHTKHIIL